MKKKCHLIFNQLRIDVIEFGHTHRRSLANIGIRVAATPPDPSRWRVEESVSSIDSTFISSCFKTTLLCFLGLLGHLQFLCHHLNLQSLKKKTKPPKKKVPPPWQTRNLENPKPAKWFQEILCHLLQSYASHGPHLSLSSCGMSIFRLGLGSFEIVGNLVPTRL